MNRFDRALLGLVRGTGAFQVLLGIVFWLGYALQLISLHMFVGLVFVLALFTLAVRGLRLPGVRGLGALTAAWGALVIAFGMTQAQILPGENHWVIRVLHLAVGIAAMGLAGALGLRMNGARAVPARGAREGAARVVEAK